MSKEILDDLDEIDEVYKAPVFAKRAMNYLRVSIMLYVLTFIIPFYKLEIGPMSLPSYLVYVGIYSVVTTLAVIALINAVKSWRLKEDSIVKKYMALFVGPFVVYMGAVAIYNYSLIYMSY